MELRGLPTKAEHLMDSHLREAAHDATEKGHDQVYKLLREVFNRGVVHGYRQGKESVPVAPPAIDEGSRA